LITAAKQYVKVGIWKSAGTTFPKALFSDKPELNPKK